MFFTNYIFPQWCTLSKMFLLHSRASLLNTNFKELQKNDFRDLFPCKTTKKITIRQQKVIPAIIHVKLLLQNNVICNKPFTKWFLLQVLMLPLVDYTLSSTLLQNNDPINRERSGRYSSVHPIKDAIVHPVFLKL